jgi:hypothetical protein
MKTNNIMSALEHKRNQLHMETLRAIRDELAKNIGTHQGDTSKKLFVMNSYVDDNVLTIDTDEKDFATGGTMNSPVSLTLWLKVHGIAFRDSDKAITILGFHPLEMF